MILRRKFSHATCKAKGCGLRQRNAKKEPSQNRFLCVNSLTTIMGSSFENEIGTSFHE